MIKALKQRINNGLDEMMDEIMANARQNPETGIGTTHDPRKQLLQAIAIGAAFLGAQWQAVLAVVSVSFLTLLARDRIIHPAKGTPKETTTDCFVMAVAILTSQVYFYNVHSMFAVDYPPILGRGIAFSMLFVFALRTAFHLNTPNNDPQKDPDFRLFRATARINIMWWLSGGFIIGSCAQAVPGSHFRDQMLGLGYMLPAQVLLRLIMDPEPLDLVILDLHSDPAVKELQGRADRLFRPVPMKNLQFPRTTVLVSIVAILALFSTTGIAIYRLFTGQGANVNWLQLLVCLGGVGALALVWLVIMEMNKRTANMLEKAINQRKQNQQAGPFGVELDGWTMS
jgi:hypothetical protein